ncbi:MAG: hypothetical protein IJQ39_05765 [Thermoguttaceae bacterium]|nr:hypothetical protein [Thermoguttaceae bacterium]
MGLDAYVPCNCYREGKTKTPPPIQEELYMDEDGFLRPVRYRGIPYDELKDDEEFQKIYDDLYDWQTNACEHKDGEYASERVGNWSTARYFTWVVRQFPEGSFPLLIDLLPGSNGGSVPAKDAPEILRELAELQKRLLEIKGFFLVDGMKDQVLYDGSDYLDGNFAWIDKQILGFDKDGLYVLDRETEELLFKAKEVMETVETDEDGTKHTLWTDVSDLENKIVVNHNPISELEDGVVGYLKVEIRPMSVDDVYAIEPLERLFKASIETGNPVFWS